MRHVTLHLVFVFLFWMVIVSLQERYCFYFFILIATFHLVRVSCILVVTFSMPRFSRLMNLGHLGQNRRRVWKSGTILSQTVHRKQILKEFFVRQVLGYLKRNTQNLFYFNLFSWFSFKFKRDNRKETVRTVCFLLIYFWMNHHHYQEKTE